jgi:phage terminase small subunit
MGKRGPQPKPTELRILEGNPSRRPLPANEPQYAAGLPLKPKRMSPGATRIWDDLIGDMASAYILRSVDQRAFWHLCEDEALIEEAYAGIWKMVRAVKKKAKEEGRELPAGAVMSMLSMTSGRMAMSAIRDLSVRAVIQRREFGLTPSSRSRVAALEDANFGGGTSGGGPANDPLERKLCG